MSKKYSLISLIENSEKYVIKDPFEKFLEEIVSDDRSQIVSLEDFMESPLKYYGSNNKVNKKSKAKVIYVSPQELPSGIGWKVLGQYNPLTHTISIANNLSPKDEEFVYYHEEAHSLGIISERQADDYAAAKVGYNLGRSYDMVA